MVNANQLLSTPRYHASDTHDTPPSHFKLTTNPARALHGELEPITQHTEVLWLRYTRYSNKSLYTDTRSTSPAV